LCISGSDDEIFLGPVMFVLSDFEFPSYVREFMTGEELRLIKKEHNSKLQQTAFGDGFFKVKIQPNYLPEISEKQVCMSAIGRLHECLLCQEKILKSKLMLRKLINITN